MSDNPTSKIDDWIDEANSSVSQMSETELSDCANASSAMWHILMRAEASDRPAPVASFVFGWL